MTFLQLADGAELNLMRPAPALMTPEVLGHALAQVNRFGGHAARPYSVAEHSLLVVDIMQHQLMIDDPHALLAGLLHDAHEAFCGDMPTPAKGVVDRLSDGAQAWSVYEHQFERALRSQYGIHTASKLWRNEIKQADMIALATEKRDLLPPGITPWAQLQGVAAFHEDLRSAHREWANWTMWRAGFVGRLEMHLRLRDEAMERAAA
jgi:uncharacterized protein